MWKIEKIINFDSKETFKEGYSHFGFHDQDGNRYVLVYNHDWIGCPTKSGSDRFKWTAGKESGYKRDFHHDIDMKNPHYLTSLNDVLLLIVYKSGVYRYDILKNKFKLLINSKKHSIDWAANCEIDSEEKIWVNDVKGCKIYRFDIDGNLELIIGDGKPGFSTEDLTFDKARFNWVYDMRKGADGHIRT